MKRVNENTELTIDSIAYEGVSVARRDGIVYFVRGGVPGDKIIASVLKKKRRYFEAKIDSIIEPSDDRIDPVCKYFGVCGGCNWQNLKYERQLFWKKQHVIDAFERIGKIEAGEFGNTFESPDMYHYRNKMEFSFGASRWLSDDEIMSGREIPGKYFALGLHVPERYDKVMDIDECYIFGSEKGIYILNEVRKKALELDVKPWNDRLRTGFLKNLIIRTNSAGDLMLILLTNEFKVENEKLLMKWFLYEINNNFGNIKSVIHAVNPTVSPVATGEIISVTGEQELIEEINGIRFRISPFSFFQTNLSLIDLFMNKIIEYVHPESSEIIWDMYCGTGAISLMASKHAKEVYGFELSESSITDAKINAGLNKIENVSFFSGDLHSGEIKSVFSSIPRPDKIILDPPRAGIHRDLIEKILEILPERIVYVSCNPVTQARDCGLFSVKYSVDKVLPIDMFPQTYHVESIALLNRV